MFQTILVAIDDSDAARSALRYAVSLANATGGKVILCNNIDVGKLVAVSGYETPYPAVTIEIMRNNSKQLLDDATKTCSEAGVTCSSVTSEGDTCDQVLQIAKEKQADLIALGTHGRQGLPRLFIGSVAEGVLRRAEVPVLVTRE